MAPAVAIKKVRQLASLGRFFITPHARERMAQRGVRAADVRYGLIHASRATWQAERATWKIGTKDLTGDELMLAVAIEASVIVVTVF